MELLELGAHRLRRRFGLSRCLALVVRQLVGDRDGLSTKLFIALGELGLEVSDLFGVSLFEFCAGPEVSLWLRRDFCLRIRPGSRGDGLLDGRLRDQSGRRFGFTDVRGGIRPFRAGLLFLGFRRRVVRLAWCDRF